MKEPLSIKYKDKVASPPIRSSAYFEQRFHLPEGALRRSPSSMVVVLRDSAKTEIPLQPKDHVVGAFGVEIGFMRGYGGVWCWLDRPDLGAGSRPIITDRRVDELIDSGELEDIPSFSITARERVQRNERRSILSRDNFTCKYCGSRVDEANGAVDHFIPVAFGGGSEDHNLQAACKECNGQGGKWHIPPRFVLGENWQDWAPGKTRPVV